MAITLKMKIIKANQKKAAWIIVKCPSFIFLSIKVKAPKERGRRRCRHTPNLYAPTTQSTYIVCIVCVCCVRLSLAFNSLFVFFA